MSESRVRENRMHGSRRRELEIGYGADIEALSTERESKPTRPTCSHYASSRPYLDLLANTQQETVDKIEDFFSGRA